MGTMIVANKQSFVLMMVVEEQETKCDSHITSQF